jgi:hypothetical protein
MSMQASRPEPVEPTSIGFLHGGKLVVRRRSISASSEAQDFLPDDEYGDDEVMVRERKVERKDSNAKRPSSVVIHDNEELLQLVDQIHLKEMEEEMKKMAVEQPKASSSGAAGLPSASLVRRNSSGYSSGSCGERPRANVNRSGPQLQPTTAGRVMPPGGGCGAGPPTPARKGSVMSKVRQAESEPNRRSSVSVVPQQRGTGMQHGRFQTVPTETAAEPKRSEAKTHGSSRIHFGSIFGSSVEKSKRNSLSHQQQPSQQQQDKPSKLPKKQQSQDSSQEKRVAFLQARSSTGLNLFGSAHRRRSSVVIPDSKSSIDLSAMVAAAGLSSPMTKKKVQAEIQRKAATLQAKASFKERSWTEIEKLWRSKAKEPPNIEAFLKQPLTRKERCKTIPVGDSAKAMMHLSTSSVALPTSSSEAAIGASPSVTRKAIELLSPYVFQRWQHQKKGFEEAADDFAASAAADKAAALANQYHRFRSVPASGKSAADVHFEEILKIW